MCCLEVLAAAEVVDEEGEGERFRVWRIKLGVGVMWEKLRWRRCEMERESESGSLRSSNERDWIIGSGSGRGEVEGFQKCLVMKSEEGWGLEMGRGLLGKRRRGLNRRAREE
ncbi:hypothetical protein RJT34_32089 [Clitoria ternatea]|uniref:Uncharacterized protein n=1 Tax=Clitoria ternatea TaxID=43366 RepID=A0AAN9EZM8_CLITE